MAANRESYPVWVCVDCYYVHHGIADDEPSEPNVEPLSLIPQDADVTSGLVEEEHDDDCPNFDEDGEWLGAYDEPCERIEFSWSACEGCGSRLGGARFALTVWPA